MSQSNQPNRRSQGVAVRKLVLAAMLGCLGYVLSTFVYFPSMAPFQHLINVVAAVFLGPYYGFGCAFLTGILRMLSGRTIQALVGAVIGAFLSGFLYQKTGKLWAAFLGEVFGTGILSAVAAYPLMKLFYGLDVQNPLYYIPYYIPSAIMGASMGLALLLILKRSGTLNTMLAQLNR